MTTTPYNYYPLINGTGTPVVHGELVRASGNNGFVRAQANSSGNVQGLLGPNGGGTVGPGGSTNIFTSGARIDVLMETGLTPVVGQTVWVSASVAGRGTNVQPGVVAVVGTIETFSAYAASGIVTVALSIGGGGSGGGAQGFQGFQGNNGAQGFQGVAGSGAQGAQGLQGFQGTTGTTGAQGFQGGAGTLSPIADQELLGNISGGSAVPVGLTKAQVNALLGVCPLTLIQTQIIGADISTVTFSGLSGDADGIYEFRFNCLAGVGCTAGGQIFMRPNGVSSNQFSQMEYLQNVLATPVPAYFPASQQNIALNPVAGSGWTAQGTIYPKTGFVRMTITEFQDWDASLDPTRRTGYVGSFWNDNSTVITSLTFMHATQNVFGIGSTLSLWKRSLS